jgi:glycine dehydrogenase subunit 1
MRYLPLTDTGRSTMLAKIGVKTIDDLFAAVPKEESLRDLPDLPKAKGELEVERELGPMAARNTPANSVPFFAAAPAVV